MSDPDSRLSDPPPSIGDHRLRLPGSRLPTPNPPLLLLVAGVLELVVTAGGLLAHGSLAAYSTVIPSGEAGQVVYAFDGGQLFLGVALGLLCGTFVLAGYAASRLESRQALGVALAGTVVMASAFVPLYPWGAQDLVHNVADARTLWRYGQNPAVVPPAAHPDDPLARQVYSWPYTPSFYGPLSYAAYSVPAMLAGDDLVPNLLAFKSFNALALIALAAMAAQAATFFGGRRVQAVVLVGWNPLILFEVVGNGHNDVLMALAAVGALALATRARPTASVLALAVSVAAKLATAALLPILAAWLWWRTDRGQRVVLAAVVFALVGVGLAGCLVQDGDLAAARFAATDRPPARSVAAALGAALAPMLGGDPQPAARMLTWGLFAAVALAALARLDRSPRSLYSASFWVMAALVLLATRQIYPWYLTWFVPMGAVLAGSLEARLSGAFSVAGLLSYAVFTDWDQWGPVQDAMYLLAFVGVPALYLGLYERWARRGAR